MLIWLLLQMVLVLPRIMPQLVLLVLIMTSGIFIETAYKMLVKLLRMLLLKLLIQRLIQLLLQLLGIKLLQLTLGLLGSPFN